MEVRVGNDAVNPDLTDSDPNRVLRTLHVSPKNFARMYHSTAVLLPDGRILVGGQMTYFGLLSRISQLIRTRLS